MHSSFPFTWFGCGALMFFAFLCACVCAALACCFFLLFSRISPEFLLVASGRHHLHFRGPRTVDSDFGARERRYYLMKNRHCAFMGFSCARCGWRQYRRYCLGCSFPFLRAPISLCRYCSFVCAALARFNRSRSSRLCLSICALPLFSLDRAEFAACQRSRKLAGVYII